MEPNLIENQKDLEPEFKKVVDDNFYDLIDEEAKEYSKASSVNMERIRKTVANEKLEEVMESLKLKFTSANNVLVQRAVILREEYETIVKELMLRRNN